ncbi:6-phospho-beta-glucosidase [Spiroplasma sp. NBRC 100390]|uniref:glycoside hydrolase family 1 protein n=1 Tax=unclassified Spiroplasma TaxID=2637901 RepID=UPI0008929A1E|nr:MULTISPECIES: glycoside hydrolase family 1 protein [unclassified Spiroplasma]AOX43411.1 6-phospho-beta-glucosidase [Spiroplasma sp. TU-14]APE12881.1 6-phospho-beta-glucosidase [Spiroplasma sp. NBRC 100390]
MGQYNFEKNFLWGSAFSGPQTESAFFEDGKSASNWDHWFKIEKYRFFNQQPCLNDFYHRYPEDIKIAKELNFNSLRTSIQWTRLIPDGKTINPKGVEFYNNVINEMLKNNIKPIINLFHFDMPHWAQEKGGWLSREVVDAFVFYARTCFELFGDRVEMFTTFNEPIVVIEGGYWYDWHRPNEVNMQAGMQAQWNSLIAHLKAVKEYRNLKLPGQIGAILSISPSIPRSQNKADLQAAKWYDLFTTNSFLDPMVKNIYPQELKEVAEKYHFMWNITAGDEDLIKDENLKLDFLGINFYQPMRVKCVDFIPDFANGAITPHYFYQPYEMPGRRMNPYRGWEIFPKAIYLALMNLKENYGNIPVYISENGMGVENEERFLDNGVINDQYRIDFVKEHLAWVHKAISEGSNCFGYHSWAYIDNWSWMNAYKNRYGFVQLDLENNAKRVLKKSAIFIAKVAKTGTFEYDSELI